MTFRGSYTVCVTPFTAEGQVDLEALRGYVDWQIDEGVHGLIPLGSTGEFLSLTREERTAVAETVITQAAGRVPVLIGTAAEWTDEAVSLSREAEALGADGVMLVPPYYSSPTDAELVVHFTRVAEALSIPVMLYNNPFTANVDLSAALVGRLSEVDNISYIKDTSKNVHRMTELLEACQGRMTVFAGYYPWESYLAGAEGYSSVMSNIAPKLSAQMFDRTVDGSGEGRQLYVKSLPLINALAGDLYVSATKAAMQMTGRPMGDPRPPRLPLPEAKRAELAAILSELGLLAEA
ncbi:4-hydroxy-tetrahydrodipicolinate synthase [Pseudooceanicola sp. CBS1P-1]|uniref:4-hydroxy-tetrahydrodipicolinate synthase n=1 Tax=Pseudooceanicola albus TaxID=2692189 RepID=A0A6L7GAY2_9RHOB|nr:MULTISPECIES: 4-hydroxy-tetrahydrodipicolinate synthase [Pseudooceanicola]MBT9386631.1 4-hydroxy-tetrahydrodipicolinate synthase [Pseudooceanicola endophyticus]MXN20747.1 4-hydroxy-tetrahydrodipicolinate synthase [Pseudooceanicola albus]